MTPTKQATIFEKKILTRILMKTTRPPDSQTEEFLELEGGAVLCMTAKKTLFCG
jgi:hypothetical protein